MNAVLEAGSNMPQIGSYPVSTTFYDNSVPEFAAQEMERLYSNLFSTLPQFAFRDSLPLSTYVACQGLDRVSVLLFAQRGSVIQVLNEGMRISEEELLRFAHAAFARYSATRIVRFHAIDSEIASRSLPCQQHPALEDIVLTLPGSRETYLANLGKSTRSYLNRYMNKMQREYPTFQHQVLVGTEIEENLLRELIDMHKARMTSKDKVSVIDDKRLEEILHLASKFGFVVVARVDDRICAGTINYRVGDNYFLETVAHDRTFNDYRIGTICSYLTVCECIARGGKEYHFLWGDYDYKFRLGGVRRELNDLYLYRSRLHMALNSDFAIRMEAKRCTLQLKKKLQQKAIHQDTLGSRIACKTLRLLQKSKHMLSHGK